MKKINGKYFFMLVLLTALFTGCAKSSDAKSETMPETEANTEAADESGSSSEADSESAQGEGEAASQIVFEGQDIDGNPVSSDIFSGSRLTMVNVWATYCNPCLSEMPGLGELAGEYDSESFQIIGIISDVLEGGDQKSVSLAASLIDKTGADYTHLLLNESIYHALLTDVTAVPTTFFIDQNGSIVDVAVGSMDKSAWEEKINGLLQEQ